MALNMGRDLIPVESLVISSTKVSRLFSIPVKILEGGDLGEFEYHELLRCLIVYTPGNTPFSIGSASNFCVRYGGKLGPSASGDVAAAGLIDQTALTIGQLTTASGLVVSQGDLYLCLDGGNPSGGDGTLSVRLLYRVAAHDY